MFAAKPSPSARGRRLPASQPPTRPACDPFVGNATVEDNLEETIEVVLWNALGEHSHAVSVAVMGGGVIELRGSLPSASHAARARNAVKTVKGVTAVLDLLTVTPEANQPAPNRMIYLRRFCAADEASTSAAIRDAVARLDAYFSERSRLPGRMVVVYRNLRPQTVTLDIAMPFEGTTKSLDGTELRSGLLDLKPVAQVTAEPGFEALLRAKRELLEQTDGAHAGVAPVFWQAFEAAAFRPWTGHPQATLYLSA